MITHIVDGQNVDNNLKKDPYNPNEDLIILVDNLTVRPTLFEEFVRDARSSEATH